MRSLLLPAALQLLLATCIHGVAIQVNVEPWVAIHQTSPYFVSYSFDTTAIFGVQRTLIPFSDPLLAQLTGQLGPAYLRIGGSLQDHTIYNVSGDIPPGGLPPGNPDFLQLYLSAGQWDMLASFAANAGVMMVFGLNAAVGRQTSTPPTWNASNVRQLLQHIASNQQHVPVFELGNEVNVFNCSGSSANMSAAQLTQQYSTLKGMLQELIPAAQVWGTDPSITGDVRGQCHSYYGDDLLGFYRDCLAANAAAPVLDASTWHYYSQFQGQNDSGIAQILTNEFQNRIKIYSEQAVALRDQFAPGIPIVVGETSSYWGGGLANVSNRYASGFWYLNQLGYLASAGYSVMIRQDVAGGNYGLLDLQLNASGDVVGYTPNPDYFSTALWKQLIGTRVLAGEVVGGMDSTGIRAWPFCATANSSSDVVLVVSNFNNASVPVNISMQGDDTRPGLQLQVYVLTPPPGAGLDSQAVWLNGALLQLDAQSRLPPFQPVTAPYGQPIQWPALSYGFVVLSGAQAPGCIS